MNNHMHFNLLEKTLGIIGYGKFGEVIGENLFPNNRIVVYSPHIHKKSLPTHCTPKASIGEVIQSADIIIPAVSIRSFEAVVLEIGKFINPSQTIIDVCSVKEYPVNILKKHLPKNIAIIATHPMFGPTSIAKKEGLLAGLPLVIYNVSSPETIFACVKHYFQSLGIQVTEMNPQEHDKLVAQSQFFAQMVRYLATEQKLNPTIIDTPAPSYLFEALSYMGINKALLLDMIIYNKFSRQLLSHSIDTLIRLKKEANFR